jgi:nitric oxide reductase subunit C
MMFASSGEGDHMTERAAKLVFWVGTLASAALFLALTWDTHRQFDALTHADKLSGQVVEGKRVFEKRNCNDCHTILGFGGYYAPDLTRAYTRVGEDTIRNRLEHPEAALRASYRKMPQQHLAAAEVARLIDFLQWVSAIDNNDWPPQDSEVKWKSSTRRLLAGAALSPGAALVASEGCLACHAMGDQGERRGPRLEWIATRRDAAYVARYLASPESLTPGSMMPPYDKLAESQRRSIAEFVISLADGKAEGRAP